MLRPTGRGRRSRSRREGVGGGGTLCTYEVGRVLLAKGEFLVLSGEYIHVQLCLSASEVLAMT